MHALFRLILLPFKLAAAAVETAFRAGVMVGRVPVKAGRATAKLLGARAVLALLAGVVLGLLLAPVPGRQLRAKLSALAARRTPSTDADLAERVSFELEHAPRTWHLPQPSVSVAEGRVVLSGAVAQESARDELGRVAGAVPGVAAVDNLVVVADPGRPTGSDGAGIEA